MDIVGVGEEDLPQCWYPMMSPLGMGLRSSPADVSSSIVPAAEAVFSKSGEAIKMAAAGKAVEPLVISTANAATK